MGAYAGVARRLDHLATVLLRPPSGHRPPIGLFLVEIRRAGPCRGGVHRLHYISSGGVLSEGYEHGGPGVCLGDGQTWAEAVPPQGGRGDADPADAPIPDLT